MLANHGAELLYRSCCAPYTARAITLLSRPRPYLRLDRRASDSECACTGGSDVSKWFVDEDYLITVKLTVPANAGSYEFCSVSSVCEDVDYRCETVPAGQTGQLQWYKDGCCSGANGCSGADSYDLWIRVRGIGAPAFECDDYVLEYEFDAGYCI